MRPTGRHARSARDLTTPTPWGFAYGRFGSKSDLDARSSNVCFSPMNRHHQPEQRRPKSADTVNFREIFGADRFSTFATVSANSGHDAERPSQSKFLFAV